jgi:hypothetical protein
VFRIRSRVAALVAIGTSVSAILAGAGLADSPPVGALPAGPTATIQTQGGQLVAFALPKRSAGRVWRIARTFDAHVVRQVSEADAGRNVVLVFQTAASGTTTVTFALTRGETATAYESRRFIVRVR